VARCHFWGFAIGGASSYLLERRLVQIATMGDIHPRDLAPLFDHLRTALQRHHPSRVHAVPVLSN